MRLSFGIAAMMLVVASGCRPGSPGEMKLLTMEQLQAHSEECSDTGVPLLAPKLERSLPSDTTIDTFANQVDNQNSNVMSPSGRADRRFVFTTIDPSFSPDTELVPFEQSLVKSKLRTFRSLILLAETHGYEGEHEAFMSYWDLAIKWSLAEPTPGLRNELLSPLYRSLYRQQRSAVDFARLQQSLGQYDYPGHGPTILKMMVCQRTIGILEDTLAEGGPINVAAKLLEPGRSPSERADKDAIAELITEMLAGHPNPFDAAATLELVHTAAAALDDKSSWTSALRAESDFEAARQQIGAGMYWPIFDLQEAIPESINAKQTRDMLKEIENPLGLLIAHMALQFDFDRVFEQMDIEGAVAGQIEVFRFNAEMGRFPSVEELGSYGIQPSTERPFNYDQSNGRLRLSRGQDIQL